jgi:hypothetical protein
MNTIMLRQTNLGLNSEDIFEEKENYSNIHQLIKKFADSCKRKETISISPWSKNDWQKDTIK